MTEETAKTDGEIKMQVLCTQLKHFIAQLGKARHAMIGSRLDIDNIEPLIGKIAVKIKELERSGIHKFIVPEPEIETPAQQPIKPEVN